MQKLPIVKKRSVLKYQTTITLTDAQLQRLDDEKKRIGAKSRTELVNLILDEYFNTK